MALYIHKTFLPSGITVEFLIEKTHRRESNTSYFVLPPKTLGRQNHEKYVYVRCIHPHQGCR